MFKKFKKSKKTAPPTIAQAEKPKTPSTKARFYGEENGVVSGAVFCPKDPSLTFNVDWIEESEEGVFIVLDSAIANQEEKHCKDIPTGHGFEFNLPESWKDGLIHKFKFQIRENRRKFPDKKKFYQAFAEGYNGNKIGQSETEGSSFGRTLEELAHQARKSYIGAHIVLVTHDMTRTGAPLIALNIIRYLNEIHNQVVTCVALRPNGELLPEFIEAAQNVIQPGNEELYTRHKFADDFGDFLVQTQQVIPTYVILNSLCAHPFATALKRSKVPSSWLFHEFPHMFNESDILNALDATSQLIAPCSLVKKAYIESAVGKGSASVRKKIENAVVTPQGAWWKRHPESAVFGRCLVGRKEMRQQWGVTEDTFVVLCVGTVDIRKGADWLVHFAQRYLRHHPQQDITFVWVGEIRNDHFAKHLQMDIAQTGNAERIRFVGTSDKMEEVYSAADLMLMVSRLDPFPNVVMEAMRHNLPVVGFDQGQGTSEIIDGKGTGAVVPYMDSDAMEVALNQYLENPELVSIQGEAAASFIREQFPYERYGADLINSILDDLGVNHSVSQMINCARIRSQTLLPTKASAPESSQGKLVLVRGHMKSGTNWLCSIINHHPEVCVRGEYHWQSQSWQNETEFDFRGASTQMTFTDRAIEAMRLNSGENARVFGDRTPCNLDETHFDNAQILYIHRDPRDILISNCFHHLNNKIAKEAFAQNENITTWHDLSIKHNADSGYLTENPSELLKDPWVTQYLIQMIKSLMPRDIESLSDEAFKSRTLIVRYETLHSNFDEEVARIFAFLGLETGSILPFDSRTKPGFNGAQDNSQFLRKGQPNDWKNYLYQEDARLVWNELSDVLIWGGYEQDDAWIDELPRRSDGGQNRTE